MHETQQHKRRSSPQLPPSCAYCTVTNDARHCVSNTARDKAATHLALRWGRLVPRKFLVGAMVVAISACQEAGCTWQGGVPAVYRKIVV